MKDTKDFKSFSENILLSVRKPSRYIGGEWNEVIKNPEKTVLHIALVFPELYEVGMSNMGYHILYNLLNKIDGVYAERVFAPDVDFGNVLRKERFYLYSLETKTSLKDFDVIAFSVSSELNFTNIPYVLSLGGVRLYSDERKKEDPVILGGGISIANPEPLWRYFDLFYFGDGEFLFIEAIKDILELKKKKADREEIIKELSKKRGFFNPIAYEREKRGKFFVIDEKFSIRKAYLSFLDRYDFPEAPIVPNSEIIFDRLSYEIARGCPQRCRFCQPTFIYHPFRWREPLNLARGIIKTLINTGFEELSLSSLSTVDYPYLEELLKLLAPYIFKKKISIGLPSMRPSKINDFIVSMIKKVRKRGFTIVPEAGSERLRNIINKHVNEDEIFRALEYAFKEGWKSIKYYFMIGLPKETESDLKGIVELLEKSIKLARNYRINPRITASIAVFIPKSHTPFQWERFIEEDEYEFKKDYLLSNIKHLRGVKVNFHNYFSSLLETLFSRGDVKVFDVIDQAQKRGAFFTAWKNGEDKDLWLNAFEKTGVSHKTYTQKIDLSERLPWEFIDFGVKKDYLILEYKKSLKGEKTEACTDVDCRKCLGCTLPVKDIKRISVKTKNYLDIFKEYKNEKRFKYIIFYEKRFPASFLSSTELTKTIERIMRRANFPFAMSEGFHPKPRFSFPIADPVGTEAEEDVFEVQTTSKIEKKMIDKLNKFTVKGLYFKDYKESEKKLSKSIDKIVYKVEVLDDNFMIEKVLNEFDEDIKVSWERGETFKIEFIYKPNRSPIKILYTKINTLKLKVIREKVILNC